MVSDCGCQNIQPRNQPTCSLLSSFFANFTLPMLPAPIVFPRIHFPDWEGMEVRVRPCRTGAAPDGVRASDAPRDTTAGPGLFAEVDAISDWEGVCEVVDRWLPVRRCGRDEGSGRDEVGGRSLLELRFDCEATLDASLAYSSWGMMSWSCRPEEDGRLL